MQQVAVVESKNVCVLTIDEIAIQMNQGFIFAQIPELKINGPKNGPSLRNIGMKRDDVYIPFSKWHYKTLSGGHGCKSTSSSARHI
jgi:hypothetical protein